MLWDKLKMFFDSTLFAPHGICLQWDPDLLVVHIASDAIIALSYFSIPFALAYFVSRRRDVEFGWVFWAFAVFIMACGLTHVMSIYTLWVPAYGLEGIVKIITAAASISTAILLWPLIPQLLKVPSPGELRLAKAMLEAEGQQRREAEERLRHAQKMEAIGQLTGGVAHDFNNLLMVISGNLEIAERTLGRWSENSRFKLQHLISRARDGALRATTLTQRLLSFARKQPFNTKVIDVDALIAGMADFFKRAAGENITLEIEGASDLWYTETDPHQLEAALLNLVVNAKDAMPSGGKLVVETRNVEIDGEYAKTSPDAREGQYVLISVSDNGTGMEKQVRERAFEPFFSTKQTGHGTGLGLSQVYGFARQSGGFAEIDSEAGRGTTVKLFLPRTQHAPAATPRDAKHSVDLRGDGQRILVVEDDEDVRNFVTETLTDYNYRVVAASNADDAARAFADQPNDIELLLTDVVMPGKNGRVLSEELLKLNSALKVIFMTGYSRDLIARDGRLAQGVELLQKPITQHDLATKVWSVLLMP
ncbi:MAG TPA: ATP-binding protein [Bradyrhizobium sp.]|uniref:ATP-binding protein n=1 Tax=Bradyrhizobium sp. TaxID=376 RepID=UPI002D7EFEB3|nr:ATP-binding protein [Bradyrhizobium sp.]HET7886687.1 ATP-binding protein [Bradyrhizobium sp.]